MRKEIEIFKDVLRVVLEFFEAEFENVAGDLGVLRAIVFHERGGHKDV